jgi:hypothetical protein
MVNLEKEFNYFARKPVLSFSGISMLLDSPMQFYKHYILKEREDINSQAMIEGSLIHMLILENDSIWDNYVILPDNSPKDNKLLILNAVLEAYEGSPEDFSFEPFKKFIIEEMLKLGYYSHLIKDEDRFKKVADESSLVWMQASISSRNKQIIDAKTYERCVELATLVKEDVEMRSLLGLDLIPTDKLGIYHEYDLTLTLPKHQFDLRGILDNLVIDTDRKIIRITDIKTTSGNIKDFKESLEKYKYWLQAVIYINLLSNFEFITPDWKIEFRFLVICKKDGSYYPFGVSKKTLDEWTEKSKSVFKMADYHLVTKNFKLPYEFIQKTPYLL